jgi:predicted amidohydrolase YtcJ
MCLHYTVLLLASALSASSADLVLRNGHIWTGDPQHPWAEALAISEGKIEAVGSDREITKRTQAGTQVIELGGRLVSPGFNDAHIHFLNASLGLFQVDLFNAGSLPEMQRHVAEFAKSHPDEPWITGGGWEYGWLPGNRLPSKEDLDEIAGERPVYLKAFDGHTGWVNSEALRRADVNGATKFSGYGEIVKDAQGHPTGILKESAQTVVTRLIPQPTRERKLAALMEGQKLAASLGITSIQNAMGTPEELGLYEELLKENKLTVRTGMAMTVTPSDDPAKLESYAELNRAHTGSWLRAGAIKLVMDGVVESRTAAMLDPYADKPDTSGSPVWTQEGLNNIVALAAKLGLQIYTHAIGDRAVRMTLDAYERVNPEGKRLRIEHIETISASDLPRFVKLGVIPSMQPIHADPESAGPWERAVGPQRMKLAFAWREFEKSGARLTFSSDWPAAIDVDPIHGIYCAVTRQTIHGEPAGGWIPEQRVGVETALRGYTAAGAYSSFEENVKGQIKPGMLADLVAFSQDLLKIPASKIHQTHVVLTILNGRIIFRDKSI